MTNSEVSDGDFDTEHLRDTKPQFGFLRPDLFIRLCLINFNIMVQPAVQGGQFNRARR